jgi:GTPase Era involved in 16S rRNA processing
MRCGFVALVGRPNVGKSTLLNALVGEDVSIVASRPQTTRDRILAVITREDAQLIVLDTPGIHRPHGRLGERMNREATAALADADAVIMVADATDAAAGLDRDAPVFAEIAGPARGSRRAGGAATRSLVAIVGRPNVGKSTLFNRLVGKHLAIVQDEPGVTRDRHYADAEVRGRPTSSSTPAASSTTPKTPSSRACATR